MLFPFTKAWTRNRAEKAEMAWEQAMGSLRSQDPTAIDGFKKALKQGAKPNFQKAGELMHPPQPEVMTALIKKAPHMAPNAGWTSRANPPRNTLLHLWAQAPVPKGEESLADAAMTALLWRPPRDSEDLNGWPGEMLSPYLRQTDVDWWGNRQGLTPRMLAAEHGHWPLLEAFAWPLNDVDPERLFTEEDKHRNHWVDHWVTGVLERGTPWNGLGRAETAARKSEDFPALLVKSNSPSGTPAARLWAHGMPLSALMAWVGPDWNTALREALTPATEVLGRNETAMPLVLLAPQIHGTEEIQAWAEQQRTRRGAFIKPLAKKTTEPPPSIAQAWTAAPEALTRAVEQEWFESENLDLGAFPGFRASLQDAWEKQARWLPAFLDAVELHYPEVMHSGYDRIQKAWDLQSVLPPATQAKRQRF